MAKRDEPAIPSAVVANAAWNLFAFACALGVNFITVPIVVTRIGLPGFGAGGLVLAIFAPFAFIGAVLSQILLRDLSSCVARRDFHAGSSIYAAVFKSALVGAAATGVIVFCAVALMNLAGITTPKDALEADWKSLLALAFVGWAAQQLVFVQQAAVGSTQRYFRVAWMSIISSTASAAAVIAGVWLFPSTAGFVGGTSVGFVISLISWSVLVRVMQPWLFTTRGLVREHFRSIFDFGKWQGAGHFITAIALQIDRYALGAYYPLSAVGQYNVASRLQEVVHMSVLKAGEVLYPHFSATAHVERSARARSLLLSGWILNLFALATLGPLIPLSSSVLALWVGPTVGKSTAIMLMTLACAGLFGAASNVFSYKLLSSHRNELVGRISIYHSLACIALSLFLVLRLGIAGAGFGILATNISRLATFAVVTARMLSPSLRVTQLLASALLPPCTAIALGLALSATNWAVAANWVELGGMYLLYGLVLCSVVVGLTAAFQPGRDLVAGGLRVLSDLRG